LSSFAPLFGADIASKRIFNHHKGVWAQMEAAFAIENNESG